MATTPRKPRATSTRQRTSARPGPVVTTKRTEIGEAIVAMITAPVEPTAPVEETPAAEPATVAASEHPEVTIDLSEAATATPVEESHEDTTSTEEVTPKEEAVTSPAKLTVVPDTKPAAKAATKPAAPKVEGLVAGRLENQQLVNVPVFLANWASTRPVVHAKGTACKLPANTTEKARKDVLPMFTAEQEIAKVKGKRTCLFCIRCTVQVAKPAKAPTK
jgi:hypothetical protein